MTTRDLIKTITFILSFALAFACTKVKEAPPQAETHASDGDSTVEESFTNVVSKDIGIVPTMSSSLDNRSTVHCANIEYLWNELINKSDKTLANNVVAKELGGSQTWRNAMDTSRLILAFGKPEDVYKSLVAQYQSKYGMNKTDLSPKGNTFWAYTDKMVSYKYAEPFDEQRLKFLGSEVSAFGFESGMTSTYTKDYFNDQFDILYFDYDGQFVVRLNPANSTDEIILVMIDKKGTFLELFRDAEKLIKKGNKQLKRDAASYNLNADDELVIPVIKFQALRNYTELERLEFSSSYGPIDLFEQTVNFNFDRNGVVLESSVEIFDSIAMPQKPKMLHFDKPFYLYIKEGNASHPYFNLWVSGTGILERKTTAKY